MTRPRCGKVNPTWHKRCTKKRNHRGYHRIEMPYTGRIRATQRATHVVLWK